MVSLDSFLSGQPLYDSTYSQYGPAYYCLQSLLHGNGGLPITHDVTRMKTLVTWLAIAVLGFLAAGLALGPAGFGMFSDLSVDGKVAPGAHSAAEAGTTRAPSAPQSLRAEKRSLALWPRGSFLRKPGGQAHPTS